MGAAVGTLLAAAGAAIASAWAAITASAGSAAVALGLAEITYTVAASASEIGIILQSVVGLEGLATVFGSVITGEVLPVVSSYSLTLLGTSLAGLAASGALLGISGGIISFALGSGGSKIFPSSVPYFDILDNNFCSIQDRLNGTNRLQCRQKKRPKVWLDDWSEGYDTMYDPEEEVLLQSEAELLFNKKRKLTKSSRVGNKTKRMRGKSAK